MQWDRSNTIGLAQISCSSCHGYGLRLVRKRKEVPCHCVLRAIFRVCYEQFRNCVLKAGNTGGMPLESRRSGPLYRIRIQKREDFTADFCIVSRRVLTDYEYRLFNFHFLLGADWRLCCRQLGLTRSLFFHTVYRIQEKLGLTFAELEPFPLYPVDEYFGCVVRKGMSPPSPGPDPRSARPSLPA